MEVLSVTAHTHKGILRPEGTTYEADEGIIPSLEARQLAMRVRVEELDYSVPSEDGWARGVGRILSPFAGSRYTGAVNEPDAPRVLQMTYYDPGSAAYRYHSALNSHPGVVSAFVRWDNTNPHCDLRQYDGTVDRVAVRQLFHSADIIHTHMDFHTLIAGVKGWPRGDQLLVHHYHGSKHPTTGEGEVLENELDDDRKALQVGARLYHKRFSPRMNWLPIPMAVQDYKQLAKGLFWPLEDRPFRVAHSPTLRAIKGTAALETAILELQKEGYDIELVLIEKLTHAQALILKASCDVTFDSFWLGIQGSGLEAAAMGQPVLAGDAAVHREYEEEIGFCPYTFVANGTELKETLIRLFEDSGWRRTEAKRVGNYVKAFHDYPAVAKRYLDIVSPALEMRRGAARS